MALIKHITIVPPGGWRFTDPNKGEQFRGSTLEAVAAAVAEYRKFKGFLPGDPLVEIQRQICMQAGPDFCKAEPGETPVYIKDKTQGITLKMAASANAALVEFAKGGFQFVDKAVANRRAEICRRCPFNRSLGSCSCAAAYKAVEAMIPRDRRQDGISVCGACGCSLQAKVNLPQEAIKASLPADQVLPPWCWQNECRVIPGGK